MLCIAPIVEGEGDVAALPHLLRMMLPEAQVARPVRFAKSKLLTKDSLKRATAIARSSITDPSSGLILLVIDADEDCPAEHGPRLLSWMQEAARGSACHVTMIRREFESWIVGGLAELNVEDPEAAGSPKQRLREINDGRYKETVDQAKFTARIDVARLRNTSSSFRRFATFLDGLHSP